MRESRTFAERTRISESDRTLKKYFLVYEGSDTEQIYFDAVNDARTKIGINPLIELIPIIRSFSEKGWSNPKKILDRIIKDIEESKTGLISYETLLNRIIDYLNEEKVFATEKSVKTIWDMLVHICENKIKKSMYDDVDDIEKQCTKIILALQDELKTENIIMDISEIIKNGGLTYAENFDKICLIVDRDRKSFISTPQNDQYAYVLGKCKEKKFGFYVTNPCFEFWLLLHFDEVFNLDYEKLLHNPKVMSKRRYAEDELRRIFPKYKKTCYDAALLVNNIDKAIDNEKKFCEKIEKLENTLGSNIGVLIDEMRKG
jgi:hypothetical protein